MSEGNGNGKLGMKTGDVPAGFVASPLNGALMPTGGKIGNAGGGRPPGSVVRYCRNLLMRKSTRQQAREILEDKNHEHFAAMWRSVAKVATMTPPGEDNGQINVVSFTLNIGTREDR